MSQAQYAGTGRRKTLLHAFALFQELVKSLLTKKMLKSTSHTLTFVWSSTNHSQLLQL